MAEWDLVRVSGRIPFPPEAVWAYLCDPDRLVHLNPDLLDWRGPDPPGTLHTGQRWVERSQTPLGLQELQTRVVGVDAIRHCVSLESRGALGTRVQGLVGLVASDGATTTVTLEHRLALPGGPWLAGAAAALLAVRVRQGSEAALVRLTAGLRAAGPDARA